MTKQPEEVREQLHAAREGAHERFTSARDAHDSLCGSIAFAAVRGYEITDADKARYRESEAAVANARADWQAARVAWYHACGKHASRDLRNCCEPGGDNA